MYCQKLACSPLVLSSQFKRRTIKEIRILPGSLPWPSGHMPATCSSVILSRIVFVVARQSHKWIMFKYLQFCISVGRHITAPLLGHHEHSWRHQAEVLQTVLIFIVTENLLREVCHELYCPGAPVRPEIRNHWPWCQLPDFRWKWRNFTTK